MTLRGLGHLMRLSWLERRMIARAAIWLGTIDLGLRLLGFQRLINLVPTAREDANTGIPRHIFTYAAAIDLAARHHVVPARCLHKSLILHFWLRREGIPSELKIGVRKEGTELRAHAWVELGGHVINDDVDAVAGFRPLSRPVVFDGMGWTDRAAASPVATGSALRQGA